MLVGTYNVNINVRDRQGSQLLHMVAHQGEEDMAKWLIKEYKINVNVVDLWKRTPLHTAAKAGQEDMYALLLDLGANEEAKDRYGKTPKDFKHW